MKLKSIILSTLSTIALPNTSCFQKCPNGETDIELDGAVYASDLLYYIADEEMTLDDVSCEELCVSIADDGWYYGHTIDSCELDLTIEEIPTESSDDSVGTINCQGVIEVCMGGRRPMGHKNREVTEVCAGAYFAACAHMEAASVLAFIQLTHQLRELNAPEDFVQRCYEAAKDEIVHAKLLDRLAKAEGFQMSRLHRCEPTSDLFSIALHNAVEGCVNENWAALLAHWQALHAPTAELRAVYRRIAIDETKHGQLAWDLHEWFLSHLSVEQQKEIKQAQNKAIRSLVLNAGQTQMDVRELGLPSTAIEIDLATTFVKKLVA